MAKKANTDVPNTPAKAELDYWMRFSVPMYNRILKTREDGDLFPYELRCTFNNAEDRQFMINDIGFTKDGKAGFLSNLSFLPDTVNTESATFVDMKAYPDEVRIDFSNNGEALEYEQVSVIFAKIYLRYRPDNITMKGCSLPALHIELFQWPNFRASAKEYQRNIIRRWFMQEYVSGVEDGMFGPDPHEQSDLKFIHRLEELLANNHSSYREFQ
jgi:hypothetical protein